MLEALRELTLLESPSFEKEPADLCCRFLTDLWLRRGAVATVSQQKHRGDILRLMWSSSKQPPKSQLLVLGHYDTVYPTGTLEKMPFRVAGGKAYGPRYV